MEQLDSKILMEDLTKGEGEMSGQEYDLCHIYDQSINIVAAILILRFADRWHSRAGSHVRESGGVP